MKKDRKRWRLCDVCYQLIFTTGLNQGNHRCPDELRAKREAELDMIIFDEMEEWDVAVEKFWNLPQIQFEQYLLDKDE